MDMAGFDWTVLEKLGIAGVAVVSLWVIYKSFVLFISQWNASTEAQRESNKALDRNSKSYEQLSKVFKQSHEREMEFQKEQMEFQKDMMVISKDTNKKVNEIHQEFLK